MNEIPEDVKATGARMAVEYRQWLDAGNSTGSLSDHATDAMADSIARAIMAERERCAKIVDNEANEIALDEQFTASVLLDVHEAILATKETVK